MRQLLTIDNPLKKMKNAFYFMLKALLVFEIFTFLSRHFGYKDKQFDKMTMVNLKIMTSQTAQQLQCTNCPISQEEKRIR